ncbi:MAG TPA: hypothetical protein VFS15_05500, partial [Kofleriaceae bacterium]|nr:hypothetical protein [Kofleriaceae bacterium]
TVTAAWDWGSTTIGKMQVCSLADRVAVAYTLGSGTNRVEVKTYDATGLLETTTIGTSSTDPDCLAMDGSNADTLWVAWNESTAVKAIGLTGDALATVKATASTIMTTASAASQLKIAMHTTSAGKARVAASVLTTPHSIAMRGVQTSAGAAATDGSQIVVPNATPIGRAFHHGGRYYLGVLPDVSRTLRSPVLCDWTDDVTYVRPVANPIPDQAEFGTVDGKWASGSSSSKRFAGLSVTRSAVATVAQLVEIDFADPQRWKTTSHERSTFLTGALATYFDGRRVQEVGFLAPPPKPTTTNSGTGITVTRTYVAVYEDVDADGNWIVSGISDPSDSVTVTDKTVTVTSAPLSVSWRAGGSSLRVAFYAAVNGSPPYYRLGSVANDTSSLTVSYSDTTTDADLVKAQTLYAQNLPSTPGESLDRRAPPGLMHLVSYNGMLVGSDGRSVFWSGQPVSGEATWFSPVFQAPLAGCSGLAAQDGSLYAFTRNAIYVTSGDVPSDNGASGGLGTFRRLVVDVGCIDARSIVTTSLGTFFQSDRGIELLNRSGAVEWVGRPVSVTTAAFPVCVGATLDADGERVIFELAAAESDNQVSGSGRAAVYNLVRRHWESTDRRKNNAGAADTAAQSACVVYSGGAYRYAWLGTDGRVYVERATDDAAAHLDPGSAWITMKAQTSWIHAGGLQGEQSVDRILFLGARSSGLDLTIETYFDYVDALPE